MLIYSNAVIENIVSFLYIPNKIFKCFCGLLVQKLLNIRTKVIQMDESKIYTLCE